MIAIKGMVALFAALPAIHALGCYEYTGNTITKFEFGNLHQDPTNFDNIEPVDLTQEVLNDISTTCQLIQGYRVPFGKSWDHCSNWPAWCDGVRCDASWSDSNHINWSIKHDLNGDDTRIITYDICYNAFKTELEACEHGSEQNHDGFWFRIDPGPRNCGQGVE